MSSDSSCKVGEGVDRLGVLEDAADVLYSANPSPKSDWTEADKLTEDEIHAAALSDPDAQSAALEQLERARRRVDVRLIRERLGLGQEDFARRFGLRLEMVRGWEDRTLVPDPAAVTLLRVIWAEPEAVQRAVGVE